MRILAAWLAGAMVLACGLRAAESNAPALAGPAYTRPSVTNLQALLDPAGDAVFRVRSTAVDPLRISSSTAEGLAQVGEDFFDAEERVSPGVADTPGVRSITLKTSYLDLLRAPDRRARNELALSSTIDVDTERGTYAFRKLGLGLLDNALWLTRELPEAEDDDDLGSVGLEFRMDW